MPYIKGEHKDFILDDSGHIRACATDSPGDLNYAFTELIVGYVSSKGLSYQTINDVVGALTCAKDEFQRRVVAKYEDSKIKENGDVYPPEWT
jgi:hypothetical protein